jgi:hypothetical protein
MYLIKAKRMLSNGLVLTVVTSLEYGTKETIKDRYQNMYPNWKIVMKELDDHTYHTLLCDRAEETLNIFSDFISD